MGLPHEPWRRQKRTFRVGSQLVNTTLGATFFARRVQVYIEQPTYPYIAFKSFTIFLVCELSVYNVEGRTLLT